MSVPRPIDKDGIVQELLAQYNSLSSVAWNVLDAAIDEDAAYVSPAVSSGWCHEQSIGAMVQDARDSQSQNPLSYVDIGDRRGFPILIQHGLIASIHDIDLFAGLSDMGARLIAIARPGYGESSPYPMRNIAAWGELVAPLVAELNLVRFDVLGISSGAPYSYALGARFPAHVRNIFILSGMPALYDAQVRSAWPYPLPEHASQAEQEVLARQLFFSHLSDEDAQRNDLRDSMMNNGFGVAQDLRLRGADWGFQLDELTAPVYLQHSQFDPSIPIITAERTARLLRDCTLSIRETAEHFSQTLLNEFILTVMARHYLQQGAEG